MTVRFGEQIRVELYGTSHGPAVGVRIEGLPAGWEIDTKELQRFLDRRAPGKNAWSTPRKEADRPVFLSGVAVSGKAMRGNPEHDPAANCPEVSDAVFDSSNAAFDPSGAGGISIDAAEVLVTDGEVLQAEIRNTNTRPRDYQNARTVPRPAHADFPAWVKYGRIESGGGQFSARLTAALCIAGGICLQQLARQGIRICTHIRSIGFIEDVPFDPMAESVFVIDEEFPVIDQRQGEAMKELIAEMKAGGDSIGGSIECMITGLPAGIGNPLFGSIESRLCQTVFAVPAVKGIEFGAGFAVTEMKGSENNDPYRIAPAEAAAEDTAEDPSSADTPSDPGRVVTETNHHGGILGGLSSGMPILFRTAMKPTPSIAMEQRSVDLTTMTETTLQIKGRHDPCIVPRAVPCIEAAAAVAIADLCLEERECTE